MSIFELAELRYHWQERAPAGRRLVHIIQILADKYEFTADERLNLGNMLQEFTDECLTVHGRLQERGQIDEAEGR